jgi:hypothetical protein
MSSFKDRFKHLRLRTTHVRQRLIWHAGKFIASESLSKFYPSLIVLLTIAGAVLVFAPGLPAVVFFWLTAALSLAVGIVMALERRNKASSLGSKLHYRIRAGGPQDAERLYETLCDSFHTESDRDELTPPEVFAAWLDNEKVHYRLIETVDRKDHVHVLKGFYSIHPLTRKAYDELKHARLHHDRIADEHLTIMNIDASGPNSGEGIVLFILDLETTQQGMDRKAAAYLLVDLLEQIRRAISSNTVYAIAALGASREGKAWCEKLGLTLASRYFVSNYADWGIYETPRISIARYIETLLGNGWPRGIREASYPYEVDQRIEQAVCVLNESLSELRIKRPRKAPSRQQQSKVRTKVGPR